MEEQQEKLKPFATPEVSVAPATAIPDIGPENRDRDFNLGKTIATWFLICFNSAAHSFLFGYLLGPNYVT